MLGPYLVYICREHRDATWKDFPHLASFGDKPDQMLEHDCHECNLPWWATIEDSLSQAAWALPQIVVQQLDPRCELLAVLWRIKLGSNHKQYDLLCKDVKIVQLITIRGYLQIK